MSVEQLLERRVDELTRTLQSMVELKSGFAEDHIKSRALQKIFAQFDIDHTGQMTVEEFSYALQHLNMNPTPRELAALFDRYDVNENGVLSFKEFSDAVFAPKPLPQADPKCRAVLEKFRALMMRRATSGGEGEAAAVALSRSLRVMDKDYSNSIGPSELKEGLIRYGMRDVTDDDIKLIFKAFDRDQSGAISVSELLRGLRGKLSLRRRTLIQMAYTILDKNGDESVTLEELKQCYRVDEHPAVKKGTRTAEDILRDFMEGFSSAGKQVGDAVSWEEFLDYYKDVSSSIDDDDYFELMMRNAWHMSGGAGWCENTSNRRVLVTHTDGHQTVQELKNDLGVRAEDTERMRQMLMAQGVKDIMKISLAH
eukprot:PhM_4_TR17632/c0_g1_i1/m.81941